MHHKTKTLFLWLAWGGVIMLSIRATAHQHNQNDQSFAEGLRAAAQHQQEAIERFKNFNVKEAFKNDNSTPEQTHYYAGVDQTSSRIKEDADSQSQNKNNEISSAVHHSFKHQQLIDQEKLAKQIKKISAIQEHASDFLIDQSYCLDGSCVNAQKEKKADADFQQVVSALSAVGDAAQQFDSHFVFKGKDQECDNDILGAANCCRDEGWLIDDLPLLHCSKKEKELGKAKENGRVHYIGQYSDDCIAGMCLKKRKVYCVFPSKLARIVQEQGRKQQLKHHFGTAEHPNCRGMTLDELQAIDFSRIDFSAFYADLAKKQVIEDEHKLNHRIQHTMSQWIDEGQAHAMP